MIKFILLQYYQSVFKQSAKRIVTVDYNLYNLTQSSMRKRNAEDFVVFNELNTTFILWEHHTLTTLYVQSLFQARNFVNTRKQTFRHHFAISLSVTFILLHIVYLLYLIIFRS